MIHCFDRRDVGGRDGRGGARRHLHVGPAGLHALHGQNHQARRRVAGGHTRTAAWRARHPLQTGVGAGGVERTPCLWHVPQRVMKMVAMAGGNLVPVAAAISIRASVMPPPAPPVPPPLPPEPPDPPLAAAGAAARAAAGATVPPPSRSRRPLPPEPLPPEPPLAFDPPLEPPLAFEPPLEPPAEPPEPDPPRPPDPLLPPDEFPPDPPVISLSTGAGQPSRNRESALTAI